MAEVRVIEALDQDGSQLWQHDGCWGVLSADRLGGQDAPAPKKCPLCGEPGGNWYPLYRPGDPEEVAKIERQDLKIQQAAREVVKATDRLNRVLGGA